jgi:hypothetical protein
MNKPTKIFFALAADAVWIIFVYVALSVVLSVSAGLRAGVMVGVAFAAGSVLAVAVGGGLRAGLLGPTKQKVWGSVIAALLLALGLWVGTHFSATFFGVYVSGPVWVIIGAVVCFLFVDQKTLRSEAGPPQPMSTQEALQIFDAYGDAMAKPPFVYTQMGKVPRDLRALPYPKERIKQALLTLLRLTPPGAAREPLEFGYVSLGDWQDTRVSDPTAAMLAEGKALLAELRSLGL